MEAGSVVGLVVGPVSVVISATALRYAKKSAGQSELSADAARRSAAAAEEQLTLARRRDASERGRETTEQRTNADLVTFELSGHGGVGVHIHNGGPYPIRDLRLDDVTSVDRPDLRWQVNRNVFGAQPSWGVVQPGEEVECPVWFVDDADDAVHRIAGLSYVVTFTFTDVRGQRWRRCDAELDPIDSG
jgi:hypothetical protein